MGVFGTWLLLEAQDLAVIADIANAELARIGDLHGGDGYVGVFLGRCAARNAA